MPRLNPLNDFCFLSAFGKKGCEPQLISLLNALLHPPAHNRITSLLIIEHTTLLPEIAGGKKNILDVRARLANHALVNIEVQRGNHYDMRERSLYYWAKQYAQSLRAGQDYRKTPKVISINILGFRDLNKGEYHVSAHLWLDQDKGRLYSDRLEFHVVDLIGFRELGDWDVVGNAEHRWLRYLDPETEEEEVERIARLDPGIKKVKQLMERINRDEGLLHAYHLYEMSLSDETTKLRGAREEGLAQGREEGEAKGHAQGHAEGREEGEAEGLARGREEGHAEGREEEQARIARELKAMGLPADAIAKATGLEPGAVDAL
jgi:predicted transposase/invertase (TIGR01784 family)